MKANWDPNDKAFRAISGPAKLFRERSALFQAFRRLPVLDRLALFFSTLLGALAVAVLSPLLLPIWLLALTKKLIAPPKPIKSEPTTGSTAHIIR